MTATKPFACSYPFDGRKFALTIHAVDEREASRHMRAIGMMGQVDGEQIAEIPLESAGGWLTRLRMIFGWRP